MLTDQDNSMFFHRKPNSYSPNHNSERFLALASKAKRAARWVHSKLPFRIKRQNNIANEKRRIKSDESMPDRPSNVPHIATNATHLPTGSIELRVVPATPPSPETVAPSAVKKPKEQEKPKEKPKTLSLEEAVLRGSGCDKSRLAFLDTRNYAGMTAERALKLAEDIIRLYRHQNFGIFFDRLAAHDVSIAAAIPTEMIEEAALALSKEGNSFSSSELLKKAAEVSQQEKTVVPNADTAAVLLKNADFSKNHQARANMFLLALDQPELLRCMEKNYTELPVSTAVRMTRDGFPEKALDLFEHVIFPKPCFREHISGTDILNVTKKLFQKEDIKNLYRFSRLVQSYAGDLETPGGMETIHNTWNKLISENPLAVIDGINEKNVPAEFLTDEQIENLLDSYINRMSKAKLAKLNLLLDNTRVKNILNEDHVCRIKTFESDNPSISRSSFSVINRLIFEEGSSRLIDQKIIECRLEDAIKRHNSIAFQNLKRRIEESGHPAWQFSLDKMSKKAASCYIFEASVSNALMHSFGFKEEKSLDRIMRGFTMLKTHDCMRAHLNLARIRQAIRAVAYSKYYTDKAEIIRSMANAFAQEPSIQSGIISYARELGIVLENPQPSDDISQIMIGQQGRVLTDIFGGSSGDMDWMLGAAANQNPDPGNSPAPVSIPVSIPVESGWNPPPLDAA